MTPSRPVPPGGRRYAPEQAPRQAEFGVRAGLHVPVVDNYDSFTFNLVQYLLELGATVDVVRNDAIEAETAIRSGPTHLLLSPRPGRPEDSGVCQRRHSSIRAS